MIESITPAAKITVTDDIVEKLITYIADYRIAPGEKLPSEKELGEALGVSRLPLREALSRLKALGIVDSRQGKGAFVCKVDASNLFRQISPVMRSQGNLDLTHMMEVRQSIEPAAAALAARRRSPESLARMEKELQAMESNLERTADFTRHDMQFHLSIAAATGNPAMEVLIGIIHDLVIKTEWVSTSVPGFTTQALASHRRVYEGVKAGDPAASAAAMMEHLRIVAEGIRPLEEEPREQVQSSSN